MINPPRPRSLPVSRLATSLVPFQAHSSMECRAFLQAHTSLDKTQAGRNVLPSAKSGWTFRIPAASSPQVSAASGKQYRNHDQHGSRAVQPASAERSKQCAYNSLMNKGRDARLIMRTGKRGALSTLSTQLGGHPRGSLVPYMLDQDARPVRLVSPLAEHTRNIDTDPRVSLLAFNPAQDAQIVSRATFIGSTPRVHDQGAVRSRYLRFFHRRYGFPSEILNSRGQSAGGSNR
ncbi:MAG: hypothetical protein EXR27_05485 [Betaproteobacteria bacterium]|nr:hypothetical protein [Betaproteobacteria bacterium]